MFILRGIVILGLRQPPPGCQPFLFPPALSRICRDLEGTCGAAHADIARSSQGPTLYLLFLSIPASVWGLEKRASCSGILLRVLVWGIIYELQHQ